MSVAETGREFVDSNLLVYPFDSTGGEKARRATDLLDDLWNRRDGCLSLQVLQEFFVTVTRKIPSPLSHADAASKVARFAEWHLHIPGKGDLLSAIELYDELRISFWDAMIVQSARALRCLTLWTEDLNDGQTYAGVLVRNPFLDSVMERR
jgi:predicted nucleic acid-binding protein